jgi:hypothetical protein
MASGTLRAFHHFLLQKAETECVQYNDDEANYEYIDETEEHVDEFIDPNEVDSNFEEQIVQDLEVIRDNIITLDDTLITVRFDQVVSLIALATDAMVRYEYEPRALPSYLIDVLGLSDDS